VSAVGAGCNWTSAKGCTLDGHLAVVLLTPAASGLTFRILLKPCRFPALVNFRSDKTWQEHDRQVSELTYPPPPPWRIRYVGWLCLRCLRIKRQVCSTQSTRKLVLQALRPPSPPFPQAPPTEPDYMCQSWATRRHASSTLLAVPEFLCLPFSKPSPKWHRRNFACCEPTSIW